MFSFLSISDSKALWPIAITAVVGIGVYYLWRTSQQAADQNNAAAPAASVGNAGTLALLAAMFGNGSSSQGQANSTMATVTPGGTANAPAAAPAVSSPSIVPASPGSSA